MSSTNANSIIELQKVDDADWDQLVIAKFVKEVASLAA